MTVSPRPNGSTSNWTDDRIARLKQLWREGASLSQIARDLGGVSRNGVIGKVRRLGLPERRRPKPRPAPHQAPFPHRRRKPSAAKPQTAGIVALKPKPAPSPSLPPECIEDASVPMHQRLTLFELTNSTCRWPLRGEPIMFCGAPRLDGSPYYAAHHARSYVPYRRFTAEAAE